MKKKNGHKKPEDTGMPPLVNRTGKATSPLDSAAQAKNAEDTPVVGHDGASELAAVRAEYERSAQPVGTMPPPASPKGVAKQAVGLVSSTKPNVLLDKLAERLAFERSGTRLYEGIIAKFDVRGTFDDGPTRDALVTIHEEELRHFALLTETIEKLGADPTVMSPCADVSAVATQGLVQVVSDPRTTLPQALHAALMAELIDVEGWELLIELCGEMGEDDLVETFKAAAEREDEHLEMVRTWVAAANAAAANRIETDARPKSVPQIGAVNR